MPLIRRLSESGWRPVNRLAACEGKGVVMEQFGDRYLTLYNHGRETADVKLSFKIPVASVRELVKGAVLASTGGKAEFKLASDDVMLLELQVK
jgi:hypothetical protein